MFLHNTSTCCGVLEKRLDGDLECIRCGQHINLSDAAELVGKEVCIILNNGTGFFDVRTKGLESLRVPLGAHPDIVEWNPPPQPAPFHPCTR